MLPFVFWMKNRSPFVKGKSQASSQPQNNPTKKSRPLSSKKPLKPLKPSNTTSKKNIKQEKKKYTKYNPDLPIIHQHLKDFIQAERRMVIILSVFLVSKMIKV